MTTHKPTAGAIVPADHEAPASTALTIQASDVLPVLGDPRRVLSAQQVKAQAGLLQQVMEAVMVPGVHYGTVDGRPPKSRTLSRTHQDDDGRKETLMLYQPGAEKLLLTFGLRPLFDAPVIEQERQQYGGFMDISVLCRLQHVGTGTIVGEAWGNCNSRERKYRWRTVYPERASKWEREQGTLEQRTSKNGKAYETLVLEVDPWEIKQTLLAQAQKRAMVRATRTALAAGDLLGVDEDQAERLREFAEEAHAEVISSEDRGASDALRGAATAAAGNGGAQPARKAAAPAAAAKPARTPTAGESNATLLEEASALARSLVQDHGWTGKNWNDLVLEVTNGAQADAAKLDAAHLRVLVDKCKAIIADLVGGGGAS